MEDAYIIKGGRSLKGEVKLSGAKNVALKIIIAALMFDQEVILKNIPRINDVFELFNLIVSLGGKGRFIEKNTVAVDGRTISKNKIDLIFGSKIRVSFMFFAPLLYRFRECYVPNPGGCRIGARPIDRIVEGMRSLNIKVDYDSTTGYYRAVMSGEPKGGYRFPKPSHTATEFLILLSIFGRDKIILDNAALEPEIDDLINFLNSCGADIKRDKDAIVVNPIKKLVQTLPYGIMTDRNEAITYATLALATKGDITIFPVREELIRAFTDKVIKVGGGVKKISPDRFRFYYKADIRPSRVETSPHPGFMTDWQQNWTVLMTQAQGESMVVERVFENRFSYIEELKKLGAKIEYYDLKVSDPEKYFLFNYDKNKTYRQAIKISGPQRLHEGVLQVTDLRAGATLAIAALMVQGESVVNGCSIMERGYEDFVEKIARLGGDIKKV
jgi:UDP-N-acetylglucosamine 1-carboxyvinyltransferase